MKQRFYQCKHCGNIVAFVKSSGVPVVCCGEVMEELIPCSVDAAHEKHVPFYTVEGNKVKVKIGSVQHPMTMAHYIEWISLQTKFGNQRKELSPDDKPEACFLICPDDEIEAVYACCNLHGLWKA